MPEPSVAPVLGDLELDIQELPSDYTQGVGNVVSLGSEVIWDAAALGAEPDAQFSRALFRYVLGEEEPETVYQTRPADHRNIGNIAGSSAGYLFSDYDPTNMSGVWRVWLVAEPGTQPILVDQGDGGDNNGSPPRLAMNDTYIAWDGLRGSGAERVAQLKVARIDSPNEVITLVSSKLDDGYVGLPALFQDEVWYGIGESDWIKGLSYPRVEMIDLADSAAPPLVVGDDVRAFMPAPGAADVVVKSGGVAEDNAINFGTLTIYRRETQTLSSPPVPGAPGVADMISYPSVGDRFVAWQDEVRSRFYLYDLAESRFWRVAELDPTYVEGSFGDRSVHGDLLAFAYWDGGDGSFVRWATLPE